MSEELHCGWCSAMVEPIRRAAPPVNGEVSERPNEPDSKSGVPVRVPWVQIPPSPPNQHPTRPSNTQKPASRKGKRVFCFLCSPKKSISSNAKNLRQSQLFVYYGNMTFNPAEEIDNEKAHSIIRDIVSGGEVIVSSHAKKRMIERRYSMQDVEHILTRGKITRKELKDTTHSWAYTIKGDDLEGDEGGVVTVIVSRQACAIITVLG